MSDNQPPSSVAECRRAIGYLRWELMMLLRDLEECERELSRYRKKVKKAKRKRSLIRRRCHDRLQSIDLLRDLIKSSPDGLRVEAGEDAPSVQAGSLLRLRLSQLLAETDPEDQDSLYDFFRRLEELYDSASDLFDQSGYQLLQALADLLRIKKEAPESQLPVLLKHASSLLSETEE